MIRTAFLSLFALAFFFPAAVQAQPVEGQACSTNKNELDNYGAGKYTQFTCDTGGTWRRILTTDPDTPTTGGSYVGVGTESPQTRLDVGGPVKVGTTIETCVLDIKGALRWNDTDAVIEYCDGAEWKLMVAASNTGGVPSTPTASDGYFVITNGTWDGDLKTAAGLADAGAAANKLCEDDLTANDWMGKADASARGLLTAANIEPFFCERGTCYGDAMPSVTYYFAVSGDAAKGGAYFTANVSGGGPNNLQNWSGTNYFGGAKTYWTGWDRSAHDAWDPNDPTNWNHCRGTADWDTNSAAKLASVGKANRVDTTRWASYFDDSCVIKRHLICFVHP